MVRQTFLCSGLAILALIGARPAAAEPIAFTGFVEQDFKSSDPNVTITPGLSNPLTIGQTDWMTNAGLYSGWAIKDIRTSYDPVSDTLAVGFNTFTNQHGAVTVVGDSYGSGTFSDPTQEQLAGGVNPASFGGDKSIAIAFAPNDPSNPGRPGTAVLIAGIPADKTEAGPGLDGFKVASYKNVDLGLRSNFGQTLTNHQGILAFDPNKDHPGVEFTIKNFSQVQGLSPANGFWISAYGGSVRDGAVGEFSTAFTRLPALAQQNTPEQPTTQSIPEPTTLLAWSILVGGAAWRLRRRVQK